MYIVLPNLPGTIIGILSLILLIGGYWASDYRQRNEDIDGKF